MRLLKKIDDWEFSPKGQNIPNDTQKIINQQKIFPKEVMSNILIYTFPPKEFIFDLHEKDKEKWYRIKDFKVLPNIYYGTDWCRGIEFILFDFKIENGILKSTILLQDNYHNVCQPKRRKEFLSNCQIEFCNGKKLKDGESLLKFASPYVKFLNNNEYVEDFPDIFVSYFKKFHYTPIFNHQKFRDEVRIIPIGSRFFRRKSLKNKKRKRNLIF